MKNCEEECRRECGDKRASGAGDNGKQAAAKERFFQERAKHHVEHQQVRESNQVCCRACRARGHVNDQFQTDATKKSSN
jgi:hypothetical protein